MFRHVVRTSVALVVLVVAAPLNPVAWAQFDLSGSWAPRSNEVNLSDGVPVDFAGIPLNDEGRTKALAYSESQLSMLERQCQGWS